jgi:predicted peptidase
MMHPPRKLLLCSIAAALLACSISAFGSDIGYTYTDTALGGYQMPYRLLLPSDYNAAGPAIPVVLFLHGAGERGTDNTVQEAHIANLINETQGAVPGHEAILILPQCPLTQVWNGVNTGDVWNVGAYTNAQQRPVTNALQAAIDILGHVEATTNANTQKVYVTGLSMGGYGTWDAITRFPSLFAAAMPLSGGGNKDAAAQLVNMPIWAYHGGSDGLVPPSGDTDVINAIKADGGHPIYSLIPGYGHGNWEEFYQPNHWTANNPTGTGGTGPDLYNWMFAQSRPTPEPASLSLLLAGGGAGAVLFLRRRKARKP